MVSKDHRGGKGIEAVCGAIRHHGESLTRYRWGSSEPGCSFASCLNAARALDLHKQPTSWYEVPDKHWDKPASKGRVDHVQAQQTLHSCAPRSIVAARHNALKVGFVQNGALKGPLLPIAKRLQCSMPPSSNMHWLDAEAMAASGCACMPADNGGLHTT